MPTRNFDPNCCDCGGTGIVRAYSSKYGHEQGVCGCDRGSGDPVLQRELYINLRGQKTIVVTGENLSATTLR